MEKTPQECSLRLAVSLLRCSLFYRRRITSSKIKRKSITPRPSISSLIKWSDHNKPKSSNV